MPTGGCSYFSDCSPEFIDRADVKLLADNKLLPAHSQLLMRASPVLAGCLVSCCSSPEAVSIPIEGSVEATEGLLLLIYAQAPQSALESQYGEDRNGLASVLTLAHKYNVTAVIACIESFTAGQDSSAWTAGSAIQWLKLACEIGLPLLQPRLEFYLCMCADVFACMPEASDVEAPIQKAYMECVLRILRLAVHSKAGLPLTVQSFETKARPGLRAMIEEVSSQCVIQYTLIRYRWKKFCEHLEKQADARRLGISR